MYTFSIYIYNNTYTTYYRDNKWSFWGLPGRFHTLPLSFFVRQPSTRERSLSVSQFVHELPHSIV